MGLKVRWACVVLPFTYAHRSLYQNWQLGDLPDLEFPFAGFVSVCLLWKCSEEKSSPAFLEVPKKQCPY